MRAHPARVPPASFRVLARTRRTWLRLAARRVVALGRGRKKGCLGMSTATGTPWWSWVWPALAWVMMALMAVAGASTITAIAAGAVLIATVFAAVHHAEVVAHRIGEPFGTLVLA